MAILRDVTDPAYRLRALLFNALTGAVVRRDRFLSLTDREHLTGAALEALDEWLTDPELVSRCVAALTAHEADASSPAGCDHHQAHDCQMQRTLLVLAEVATAVRA